MVGECGPAFAEPQYREILEVIKVTCVANDRYWRSIYSHGMWIPRREAVQIVTDGWTFTEPKLDMDHQLKSGVDFVMSPTAHMTWADEDFIGVKEEMEVPEEEPTQFFRAHDYTTIQKVAVGAIIRISPGHHVHTSDFVKTGVGYHSTHHDPTTMNILLPEKLASKGNTSSIDDNALHTGRISAAAIQKTLEALPAPRLTNLMSIPFCDWVLKIQIPVLPRVIPHPRRYTCPPK
ncbi:unnamed protein product [Durusdinium trenchii]|uniref:Uncharacterized protein n=1 Tax=Durusdinium trenchii TaxID=1381693 RepID=A0ABP0QGV1_9DINO